MAVTVGERMKDFTLPLIDGGAVDLEALRGKKTLIFVWASW